MKLNQLQQGILDKMRNGWELGSDTGWRGYSGGCWLQEGGLGKGGRTIKVSRNTLYALLDRKLIKQIYGFPTSRYTLTEAD